MECDGCGLLFHIECCEFEDILPFWYCYRCQLDPQDPCQNLALLSILSGYDE
jgi:hypothetical protein